MTDSTHKQGSWQWKIVSRWLDKLYILKFIVFICFFYDKRCHIKIQGFETNLAQLLQDSIGHHDSGEKAPYCFPIILYSINSWTIIRVGNENFVTLLMFFYPHVHVENKIFLK